MIKKNAHTLYWDIVKASGELTRLYVSRLQMWNCELDRLEKTE